MPWEDLTYTRKPDYNRDSEILCMRKLLQKKYLVQEELHFNGMTIEMKYFTTLLPTYLQTRADTFVSETFIEKFKRYWKNYTVA